MALFTVDEAKCLRDGVCSDVCGCGVIEVSDTGFPSPIPNAEIACTRCWHCVMCCPTGAFEHQTMSPSLCVVISPEPPASLEQVERLYISRKSTRSFLPKPVSRDDVTRLLELSQLAPSSHNRRGLEWIIIDDKSAIERLATVTVGFYQDRFDQGVYDSSSHWSVFMRNWFDRWHGGIDVMLHGAPVVLICHSAREAVVDGSIALTYIELAAAAMGLGTCWLAALQRAINGHRPTMDAVGLPEGHRALGAMVLGYPKHRRARRAPREALRVRWV